MCIPTLFSSSCTLPFPTSAGIHLLLFGQFIGTTAQSDFSSTCMSALWFMAFADRPSSTSKGVLEISRFSCMLFSWRARALRLRRTGQPLANNAAAVLPSSISEGIRHPDLPALRSSITPPTNASVYASSDTSRSRAQGSRSGGMRCLLAGRGLHPYNMPV